MKILKFGGSSVGTPERIKKVMGIVRDAREKEKVAIVVSAFEGVTDELLRIAEIASKGNKEYLPALAALSKRHLDVAHVLILPKHRRAALAEIDSLFGELREALQGMRLVREISPKTLDFVMSFGERLAAFIISRAMSSARLPAEFLDARSVLETDQNFGNANVDVRASYGKINDYFGLHAQTQVVTGFIGSTAQGETTTLGRGGSDYSAALFGAALNARAIEIWTDVTGVMSADPRVVPGAKTLPRIDYEEMIEMAYFGAKVVHPATMLPAIRKKIPILIKNTFNPKAPGTLISPSTDKNMPIKGVAAIDGIVLVNLSGTSLAGIPGSAARVFGATARAKANVILISQASSEHTICLAIKSAEGRPAIKALRKEFADDIKDKKVFLSALSERAIIAVVGGGMKGIPDTAGKLFHALGEHRINISAIAQGSSERNISFVVASKDMRKAMNVVHEKFFT